MNVAASCAWALLLLSAPALAQEIVPLTDLPAAVAASHPDLVVRRAALMRDRTALHGRVNSLNSDPRCAKVEEGSADWAWCRQVQAELTSSMHQHDQESKDFNALAKAAILASTSPASLNDPSVVDARDVPTGLPASVAAEIPATAAGDRVRRGFQSAVDHDWNAAHAWFQDALNHDPGNAGIQRLIELAEFTLKRPKHPRAAAAPLKPAAEMSEQDRAAMATLDQELDRKMDANLAQALADYASKHPELRAPAAIPAEKTPWGPFFRDLFVDPSKKAGPHN